MHAAVTMLIITHVSFENDAIHPSSTRRGGYFMLQSECEQAASVWVWNGTRLFEKSPTEDRHGYRTTADGFALRLL